MVPDLNILPSFVPSSYKEHAKSVLKGQALSLPLSSLGCKMTAILFATNVGIQDKNLTKAKLCKLSLSPLLRKRFPRSLPTLIVLFSLAGTESYMNNMIATTDFIHL